MYAKLDYMRMYWKVNTLLNKDKHCFCKYTCDLWLFGTKRKKKR